MFIFLFNKNVWRFQEFGYEFNKNVCQLPRTEGKGFVEKNVLFFPSPSLFINSFGISKPSGIIKISELVGHVSETRQSVKIYTLNNKKKDFSILFFSLINIRYFTV
jgi:hypothetical protein